MNRLFGTKSAAPKPTLDGAIANVSSQSPLLNPTHYDLPLTDSPLLFVK